MCSLCASVRMIHTHTSGEMVGKVKTSCVTRYTQKSRRIMCQVHTHVAAHKSGRPYAKRASDRLLEPTRESVNTKARRFYKCLVLLARPVSVLKSQDVGVAQLTTALSNSTGSVLRRPHFCFVFLRPHDVTSGATRPLTATKIHNVAYPHLPGFMESAEGK